MANINKEKNIKAFTLVELLVVISIIGILSSFAMVSLNTARIKARDALRSGEMNQLRTALVMYFDDYLTYPVCGTVDLMAPDFGATDACYNLIEPDLRSDTPPHISKMPYDPMNPTNDPIVDPVQLYGYVSDGKMFFITYHLESKSETEPDKVVKGF